MADERPTVPGNPRQYVERRKRPDWVVRTVSIISVAGWVVAVVILALLDRARPQGASIFSRMLGVPVRSTWNTDLLRAALFVLIGVFLVCLVGFFFNMSRHRRKTDKYSKSIIILGSLSLVGIAVFLLMFATML